jgi:hypothetical protein
MIAGLAGVINQPRPTRNTRRRQRSLSEPASRFSEARGSV